MPAWTPSRTATDIAENLFTKALAYHPDARAYLGLAMLRQKRHRFADAMEILTRG
jgi:anaerobic magnesium-protoporphyrin IX monomethyl ester cyclase